VKIDVSSTANWEFGVGVALRFSTVVYVELVVIDVDLADLTQG